MFQLFWRHSAIATALLTLLIGFYWLLFRGWPQSTDELTLFSMTDGFLKTGNFVAYSAYNESDITQGYEPLQMILAAPLYWLGLQVPGVGLLHLTWLFNLLVGAGTAVTLYLTGVSQGYTIRASLGAALVMATGTLLLPYSLTFFREPLAGFWVLLAALLALHLRQHWRWSLLIGFALACFAAFMTKIATVAIIIPLLMLSLPTTLRQRIRLAPLLISAGILVAMGLIVLLGLEQISDRFATAAYIKRLTNTDLSYFLNVTGAYLISPGRSVWATSPALLLSLYGAYLLYRQKRLAEALVPLLALVLLACSYGLGEYDWHGGRGWASRYLVPVVPVLSLLLLPVMEKAWTLSRRWQAVIGGLILFSITVEIVGTLMPLDTFYSTLIERFPENPLDAFYSRGTWQFQYSQWWLTLRHFDPAAFESAWKVTPQAWIGLPASLVMISMSAVALWRAIRQKSYLYWQSGGLLLLTLAGLGVGLVAIYADERSQGSDPNLRQLVEILENGEGDQDIVYLASPEYQTYFFNYYKGASVWFTFPFAVGERYSYEQIPRVVTTIPEDRLAYQVISIFEHEALNHETAWVIEAQGPYHPWAYRPTEHYFTRHHYPIQTVEITPNMRLIQFDLHPAPLIAYRATNFIYTRLYTRPMPETEPFIFGDNQVWLTSYLLPATIQAGEVLPVSLRWMIRNPIDRDYNIGVYVLNEAGELVARRDGPPQNSFGNTQRWQPGVSELDHHGVAIPADLPPGTYTVQVIMYDWRDAQRLPVTYEGERIAGDYAAIATLEVMD